MVELTFYRDLARGKQLEQEVLSMVKAKYQSAYIKDG